MSVLVRTFNLTGIDVEKIEDGWRHRCFPFVHLSTILTILYCSRVPAAVLAVTIRGHELHPDDVGDPSRSACPTTRKPSEVPPA